MYSLMYIFIHMQAHMCKYRCKHTCICAPALMETMTPSSNKHT